MENYIGEQLLLLLAAALLGAVLGLAYDLLWAVRRRFSHLLGVCDALFCLCVAAGLVGFFVQASDGELRLYLLLGALAGWCLRRVTG